MRRGRKRLPLLGWARTAWAKTQAEHFGFNNAPQALRLRYELTTYRQPLPELSEALVDVLGGNKRTEKLDEHPGNLISSQKHPRRTLIRSL